MNRIHPDEIPKAPPSVETLSFAELVSVMLERRRLIAVGFLAGLLIGALYVGFLSPLYRSQGVFNLQYISFAEYKRYSPALVDRERFLDYAARSKQFSDAELDRIRGAISGPDALGKWVHPLFTITKTDVKDVAEVPKDANLFSGVDIDVSLNSRELAQKLVVVCGEYVRDFVIEGKIYDLVYPSMTTFTIELTRKELDIIRATFEHDQLKRRLAQVRGISDRYPGASRETQRQVISTQDGGERYLSPVTQVIGVEAQIVEANADIAGMERERERLTALIEFYKQARAKNALAKTGEQLRGFSAAFDALQAQSNPSEAKKDAIGTVKVEVDQLKALNSDYMRFAGLPSSQSQFRSILVWSPLVLGPIVGLLLAILAAIVLEWWRRNRSAVLATNRH